ncbi:ATP-binding protein [uncultured Neptuniibacter sp.]|uniref:sensor histidine kinase n=1 Tax=uncultured Neptuniibacter sp. TaxID=502143 RepID=UPI002601E137|nr:ATP-binding protein [uncultured Neptuniibacter sp.]
MSLRLKTILGIAIIEAILLILLVSMTLDYLRTTNYESLNKRAQTTATLFATTTKEAVLSYDLASLDAFVSEVMKNPDLVYARVLGPEDVVFAQAGEQTLLVRKFTPDHHAEDVSDGTFDTFAEIREGGAVYGRVELGLDINSLTAIITEAERRSATVAALEMGLVAMFSFILGTYLTRQLKVLSQAAKSISSGNLATQVPIRGKDEVAEVASAFNAMTNNLHEAHQRRNEFEEQLKELNRNLEQRVQERTEELVLKNRELEQANREIKLAQAKLLQSEKMASVGVLAAGVAHEINNPLGFVISNLRTLENYANNYRDLIKQYQVIHQLNDHAEIEKNAEKLKSLEEQYDLEFMNDDLDELLKDTQEGSNRVKEIVKSLKSFSHVDHSEKFEPTDLNECIETTLKVVNNELKYHCTVNLNLEPIPLVECIPGQIKQVLLNILINAGQAIVGEGTIIITTRNVDDYVEVAIQDSGSGIPADRLGKLFDPFYTTKPVGEGSGLGLAISFSIIEDHHGEILVNSEPDRGSCFTLKLPINQNQARVTEKKPETANNGVRA